MRDEGGQKMETPDGLDKKQTTTTTRRGQKGPDKDHTTDNSYQCHKRITQSTGFYIVIIVSLSIRKKFKSENTAKKRKEKKTHPFRKRRICHPNSFKGIVWRSTSRQERFVTRQRCPLTVEI